MNEAFIKHIETRLSAQTEKNVHVSGIKQVFGGDINVTCMITSKEGNYFIKTNNALHADMYEKEFAALKLLYHTHTLKIPQPIFSGVYEANSYLLMEYLGKGAAGNNLWQQLATGLALLHKNSNSTFGLLYDNYIGTIPQHNKPSADWPTFYAAQRILPLIKLAHDKSLCDKTTVLSAEKFCKKLSSLLPEEAPALLHGDLWSGNKMFTVTEEAAVYDPAIYYGHREMDIAMTLLFGGFPETFYAAYHEAFPLQKDWQQRTDINQLYPLLVHLNLFGRQYYNAVYTILAKYA